VAHSDYASPWCAIRVLDKHSKRLVIYSWKLGPCRECKFVLVGAVLFLGGGSAEGSERTRYPFGHPKLNARSCSHSPCAWLIPGRKSSLHRRSCVRHSPACLASEQMAPRWPIEPLEPLELASRLGWWSNISGSCLRMRQILIRWGEREREREGKWGFIKILKHDKRMH